MRESADVASTVVKTVNGTPVRLRDVAEIAPAESASATSARRPTSARPGPWIGTTSSKAPSCCTKAPTPTHALEGVHAKVKELNEPILPPGVKIVPFLDRSTLVNLTTHTVMDNLTNGIVLVVIILFIFLGNVRGAIIVALTIPFSLLFASICLDLRHIPANLLSLGALDFGMVVDGAVVMVENSSAMDAAKTSTAIL